MTTSTYSPPEDTDLKLQAIQYLRENKPLLYSDLKRSGELGSYVQERVEATKTYASNLIASGEFPPQAWYRAICLEICGRETD